MNDRRAHPRRSVELEVFAAVSPERALPRARAIDIGRGGMLLAFVEPVGLLPEDRVLLTFGVGDSRVNALVSVARRERGDDFRTYVAVRFEDIYETDYDQLCDRLDDLERAGVDAPA